MSKCGAVAVFGRKPAPALGLGYFSLTTQLPFLGLSEKLKKTLNAYHNRAIATQEVIEELIKLAKELSASP